MRARPFAALTLALSLAAPASLSAQASAARNAPPTRAIRRDIPLTNMIRRAFAAGTRDSTGRPGRNYWQTSTEYTIQARLDVATSTITGRERVVIHNNSDSAMNTLQMRLDQNIFAPNVPRAEQVTEITDGMNVTRLAVNGENVDLHPPRFVPFRGPNAGQRPIVRLAVFGINLTTARITLPTPIAGHGTATLEAEWSFRVARADSVRGMRMGRWADSLYQVAQWYPRVAVFDDLREGGWDTDPYLGPSEFYNNFGRFDVTLDVPAGWLVAATGLLQNAGEVLTQTARDRLAHVLDDTTTRNIVSAAERGPGQSTAAGDRLQWHFAADSVADFAWATSSQYVWDASRATIPGKGDVPIQIFYLPGHAQAYAAAGPTVRHALEFYSHLWMPYAFPQLTIVDGPEGGMEYPSFIMSSVGASDHETGHQWWPMMVGTNETWYGFMDEGFNQYMNILSRQDRMHQPFNLDLQG
ncbi:MAG: M1 family metallopeptidase, partial [Acidimicrobiales bacterium]